MNRKNVPSKKVLRAAAQKLKAAVPASGFRPQTPEEWKRAHEAMTEVGYGMFRLSGASHEQAQELARAIYGGQNGLTLLDAALREHGHEE